MTFKIDENMPLAAAAMLRADGHHADTVMEEGLAGSSDATLAAYIQQEHRTMITLDLDFSDIRSYPPTGYPGIIVLRTPSQDKHSVLALLQRVLPILRTEPLEGRLWIVESDRVRIR